MSLGTWWLDGTGLRDRRALMSLVDRHAVRGVVCGHLHQKSESPFGRATVCATPSTCYQFRPHALFPVSQGGLPGLRLFDTRGVEGTNRVVRAARIAE